MRIRIGTFNLNNLFSRYNFQSEIDAPATGPASEVKYTFGSNAAIKLRTYQGRLIKAKDDAARNLIAQRIKRMNLDVLAVQEVEDVDTLRQFNRDQLGGLYSQVLLIEGNDPRFIDIGLLSRLPVGGVTSWQRTVHPSAPNVLVFSRDLIEVEVLNAVRTEKLFTLFNTHLKSNYVDFKDDPTEGQAAANERRQRQAETIGRILKARTRPDSRFALVGDMNDAPDSPYLRGFTADAELKLVNGLKTPKETQSLSVTPAPTSPAWTHRYKEANQPARYELYDHVWLSPALASKQVGAWIDRRTKLAGDGSDHDPSWVEIEV